MKKMKYCIAAIFAVLLLTAGNKALAAPICPVPLNFTQPDGSVITVTAYGDEFFSWSEDENGNVITYDEVTDSYKYAEIKNGKLVPAFDMAGTTSQLRRSTKKLRREDVMPLWENADRVDYSQKDDDRIQPLSENTDTTPKKLLTFLIEFNDVKLKYDSTFWAKRMYSTDSQDISVVNYWKENANGKDIFEPSDTSGIQDGATGVVNYGDYTNIGYKITKCPQGVVKVSLDMPHPVKVWDDRSSMGKAMSVAELAIEAIDPYYKFKEQMPYPIAVLAGNNEPFGEGVGQIRAFASTFGASIPSGEMINRCVVQPELFEDTNPAGIGITCHELGHSVYFLPDLYLNMAFNGWVNNGVMYYSLMCLGSEGYLLPLDAPSNTAPKDYEHNIWKDPWVSYPCHVPAHLDPWCKMKCGFITPTMVDDWDGDINSISEMGVGNQYNVLMLRSRTAPNQYFLVENRQLVGYDAGLEAWNEFRYDDLSKYEGGIIIWHIDEAVSKNNNNNAFYHHFMHVEDSKNSKADGKWEFLNMDGRNKLNGDTEPNSNLYQKKYTSCSEYVECHPQTLKSGISIEVVGKNGPSVRVKANVDQEYRVSMIEGARFTDIFPDPNFCRAVIDNIKRSYEVEKNPNSLLTAQDWILLSSLKSLRAANYGIRDLSGVKYCPMITSLDCNNNELISIPSDEIEDLLSFSCDNNHLSELDVSHWSNLAYLYCSGNQILEIDISHCPILTDFVINDNLLTSLDTSQNSELRFLECTGNKLTELDLTNNSELEYLWCYENYMDLETPDNSIVGLEPLREALGPPHSKDDQEENWFTYFPQNTNEHEHSWERAWQKNNTHHWHNCADENCPIVDNGDKDGYAAHTKTRCSSRTQHWEVCSVCGWTGEKASHIFDGDQDTTCNICGYVRTVTPPVPISPPGPSEPVEPDLPDTPENCSRDENCALGKFTDTDLNAWYHNGVHYCLENGLMKGYSENTFAPNDSLTRAMLAQILYSEAGQHTVPGNSPFDDVASGAWYAKAVAWAEEHDIVAGYGDNIFGPDDSITREQLAVMLWRYAGNPTTHGTLSGFTDQGKVSGYAVDALRWAVEKGILSGKGNGILDPAGKATRAEAAVMLYHYFTLEV